MTTNNAIKTLTISDLHLGIKGLTETIISNLDKAIPNNESIADLDIIFIAGDVFDEMLYLPAHEVIMIQQWIHYLLYKCAIWDIILIVLEGTPSHDRKQSKQFLILNNLLKHKANVLYVDTLRIEHIDKLGINVLFIPDEWRGDSSQTQLEVIELLKTHNLKTVDYTIMHGCCEFQLPPQARNASVHSSDFYSSITSRYVFIGHHHVPNRLNNILIQGSFDRLRHGEEENKGYYYVESFLDKNRDIVTFKVNKTACIFKTISIVGLDKQEVEDLLFNTITKIKEVNEDYSIPTSIKIVMSKNDVNEDVVLSYKKGYLHIKWMIEIEKVKIDNTLYKPKLFVPVPINSNTILGLVDKRIRCLDIEDSVIINCLDILNDLKNKVKV